MASLLLTGGDTEKGKRIAGKGGNPLEVWEWGYSLFVGDYKIGRLAPEGGGVENLDVGGYLGVVLVHYGFVAVGRMFGEDGGTLLVDGDGGNLGAVDAGEMLGAHIGRGGGLLADAEETAGLAGNAFLYKLFGVLYDVVSLVGLSNLTGDGGIFLLVALGEGVDVLVQTADNDLVLFEFGEKLRDLVFLVGDALLEVGNKLLEFGVLLALGSNLGVEFGKFVLVVGKHAFDGRDLILDFALYVAVFDAAVAQILHFGVFVGNEAEVLFDLGEEVEEFVDSAIFFVNDTLERVDALLLKISALFFIVFAGYEAKSQGCHTEDECLFHCMCFFNVIDNIIFNFELFYLERKKKLIIVYLMKKTLQILLLMTVIAVAPAMGQKNNPLAQEWKTPFHTPPFQEIKNEHYKPAMRAAMKEHLAAVEKIAKQKAEPTFENTIVAMETCGSRLEVISAVLFNLNECNTNDEIQKIVEDITPELTRHYSKISLNEKLFQRVKKLYDARESLGLNAEQMRLLEVTYKGFVRSGALLSGEDKKAFAAIEEELSLLSQKFNVNVLADANDFTLHLTKEENLAGLTPQALAAAKQEAERRNLKGWVFTLQGPSYSAFMTYSENRNLRELMYRAYNTRGNRGNDHDNNEIVRQIVKLRSQKAKLLGYDNYSAYALDDRMARNIETVSLFLKNMIDDASPVAVQDYNEVQEYAIAHGFDEQIRPWDFSYWSNRCRKDKYAFDTELLRPYFAADKVTEGIFELYNRLYGLTFKENKDIQVYDPMVKAYEVLDGSRLMGVLYLDLYPRAGKRAGAWKVDFRSQSNLPAYKQAGIDRPVLQIVCSFTAPIGDKPALLSFSEVRTFMHEFGHAIHNLLSDVTYPSLSGTSVLRDFVELPSQIMENWIYEQEFLNLFAHHYETGDTLPAEYVEKIKASQNFLSGYNCIRQINFGLIDMAYHSLDGTFEGRVDEFESKHTIKIMADEPGCCSSTAFSHIFSGGYASGYYGYKWAEALDADAFTKFQRNGIFDKATARQFRNTILSLGGTKHPADMFRDFMGRDPDPTALSIRSGFVKLPVIEK